MATHVVCPICTGKGTLPLPKGGQHDKALIAHRLREAKFTLVQIRDFMHFKHHGSVQNLLRKMPK